jgi:hypothetical protein
MAIKTFINGQENGVITFKGDTEPCSVYVNGEKQDNLSYYGVDVTGENSVTYESEYKKNIRTMKADGNTFQQTYEGYQLLELKDSSGSKTDSEGNVLSWEVKDGIVTVNGMSNVFTTINVNYTKATNSKFKAGTYTYTPYYYKELGDIGMTGCDWQFGDKYFGNSITGFTSKTKGLETKTFEHDWSFGYCALYINANTQYDNYQYAPAILKGTYATLVDLPPYEPYVGGIPSPNAGQTYEVQNKVESLNAKDYTYYSDGNDYIYVTQEPIALTEGISYEIDTRYAGAGTPPSDFTLGVAQTREDFFASQGNPLNVTWLVTNGTPTGNKPVLEPPFYIGVGSTNTPVTDKDVYINALYDYFIVFFNSYSKVTIPAYPQPIENANDNGMSLVNCSTNIAILLDKSETTITSSDGNVLTYSCKDGVVTINGMVTDGSGSLLLNFDNTITYKAGIYSRTNNYFNNNEKLITGADWRWRKPGTWTNIYKGVYIQGIQKDVFDVDFQLNQYNPYIRRNFLYENYQFSPGVFVGKLSEMPPYEPYFKNTIPIPASVTKADGTVVELRMGKIGDYADNIVVDRLANKVLYNQKIEKINALTDTSAVSYGGTSSQGGYCYYYYLNLKKKGLYVESGNSLPLCNNTSNYLKNGGEPTSTVVNAFRYRYNNSTQFLYFLKTNFGINTTQLFKEWLAQNETIIEYVLDAPITHDITDTDLGQALLNLATQNQQNTITITSQPSITALNVNYAKWGGTINANTNT